MKVDVVQHVPHQYSQEMSKQSNLVTLGLINANPSSNDGVTQIMRELQRYCPRHGDKVVSILCNGDGLSIDRMRSAKEKMVRAPTAVDRLEGLVSSPQEFHAEALFLQVGN
jgi:(p)ppGpp synthase/HD superfamily hydrolase